MTSFCPMIKSNFGALDLALGPRSSQHNHCNVLWDLNKKYKYSNQIPTPIVSEDLNKTDHVFFLVSNCTCRRSELD